MNDVVVEDGRLVEFGDLVVKADSIELETIRSDTFAKAELERTFKGRLEKGMLANLLTDIPFEVEFGVMPDGKIATRSSWFDGQIESTVGLPGEPNRYQINGFSPEQHLTIRQGGVSPAEIHLAVVYDQKSPQKIASLEPDGSLILGQSKFEKFRLADAGENERGDRRYFLATAQVDDREVEAEIYLLKRLPLIGVRLQKAGDWSLEDTWARTIYGKAYGDLEEPERDRLQESMDQAERRFGSSAESNDSGSRASRRSRRGRSDRDDSSPNEDQDREAEQTEAAEGNSEPTTDGSPEEATQTDEIPEDAVRSRDGY